jgi:hypothetical protein
MIGERTLAGLVRARMFYSPVWRPAGSALRQAQENGPQALHVYPHLGWNQGWSAGLGVFRTPTEGVT